ncbi:MAG: hypothetical protein ACJ8J0_20125, partial [Longimicrobiaceae bacterium]
MTSSLLLACSSCRRAAATSAARPRTSRAESRRSSTRRDRPAWGAFTLSITATPGEATGSYVPAAMSTCTSLRANGGGTATTSTHAAPSPGRA